MTRRINRLLITIVVFLGVFFVPLLAGIDAGPFEIAVLLLLGAAAAFAAHRQFGRRS